MSDTLIVKPVPPPAAVIKSVSPTAQFCPFATIVTAENVPEATVTVTVHPVPPHVDVVAVHVYVPSVYPDPVPVTVSPVTSPNALTAAVLLF